MLPCVRGWIGGIVVAVVLASLGRAAGLPVPHGVASRLEGHWECDLELTKRLQGNGWITRRHAPDRRFWMDPRVEALFRRRDDFDPEWKVILAGYLTVGPEKKRRPFALHMQDGNCMLSCVAPDPQVGLLTEYVSVARGTIPGGDRMFFLGVFSDETWAYRRKRPAGIAGATAGPPGGEALQR